MRGLDPRIPIVETLSSPQRDCRDHPGDDALIHAPRSRPHRSCRARSRRGRRALSAARLHRRARAIGIRGARTITSFSCPDSSSNCSASWSRRSSAAMVSPNFSGDSHQRFLARQEGLSFLMLESRDVAADAAELHAAGICRDRRAARSNAMRPAPTAPGRRSASRSLSRGPAGARDRLCGLPAVINPENFWNPALQQHANSGDRRRAAPSWSPRTRAIITSSCRRLPASANCTRHRAASPRRRRAATSGSWTRPRSAITSGSAPPDIPRARASPRCASRCATRPA